MPVTLTAAAAFEQDHFLSVFCYVTKILPCLGIINYRSAGHFYYFIRTVFSETTSFAPRFTMTGHCVTVILQVQQCPVITVTAYEGTIAQDIERFGLRSLTVEDTLDSIKSIDWVLFAPHGIRSYFAKPFYTEQGLHAILILASIRPGSFGADAETRFASLMGPFERLIGAWRKG